MVNKKKNNTTKVKQTPNIERRQEKDKTDLKGRKALKYIILQYLVGLPGFN